MIIWYKQPELTKVKRRKRITSFLQKQVGMGLGSKKAGLVLKKIKVQQRCKGESGLGNGH